MKERLVIKESFRGNQIKLLPNESFRGKPSKSPIIVLEKIAN